MNSELLFDPGVGNLYISKLLSKPNMYTISIEQDTTYLSREHLKEILNFLNSDVIKYETEIKVGRHERVFQIVKRKDNHYHFEISAVNEEYVYEFEILNPDEVKSLKHFLEGELK